MQKTKKAAAKRFKFTATGKVKFGRANMRHNLGWRRQKTKLRLRHGGHLSDVDVHRVEAYLPYGSVL